MESILSSTKSFASSYISSLSDVISEKITNTVMGSEIVLKEKVGGNGMLLGECDMCVCVCVLLLRYTI